MAPEYNVLQLKPKTSIKEKRSKSVDLVVKDKLKKARSMFPDKAGFIFVTDVGFHIAALGGAPGALIKRETQERFAGDFAGWCRLLDKEQNRDVKVSIIIGAKNNNNDSLFVKHSISGEIPQVPEEGDKGFGWDKIFVPDWKRYNKKNLGGKSLAQVSTQDKSDILRKPLINKFKQGL